MVLFHDGESGRPLIDQLGRQSRLKRGAGAGLHGIPARVIPFEVHHAATVGIDLALSTVALGASQVAVLLTGCEAPQYAEALASQFRVAQTIIGALGYGEGHFVLVSAGDAAGLDKALAALAPARSVRNPAGFEFSADKRTTLEFAIEHLVRHSPDAAASSVREIALPPGAPFGRVDVDAKTCTLCMACVGACPESALMDTPDAPQLRFLERNCVQCGLCEQTCPEKAITLVPRLLIATEARVPQVLNSAEPFHCVSCGKAFGTRQMVDNMVGKLAGHSMFAGNSRRLQMCADCRVVDMMANKGEANILDIR
jgi:ferredoxin